MTKYHPTPTKYHPTLGDYALIALMIITVAAVTYTILNEFFSAKETALESALCDRQVEALLHSKDPVEIERAGIIIRRAHCRLNTRLQDEP